ncbi:hypothetical protein C1646_667828 [Rhizophagus diaphanus]|nr:hypothetical protein C1646_667828 [Rhizophagus diaphanus] [Rhizophagus sp. MUCL 43196]
MGKILKQKSIRSRKPSKSGRRIPNAWIIFSNEFYNKHYRTGKTKRTIVMKSAKFAWNSMSAQEKVLYYYQYEQLRKSKLNCNPCNEIIFVLNAKGDDLVLNKNGDDLALNANGDDLVLNENEDDQYNKFFDEVINPEMVQD